MNFRLNSRSLDILSLLAASEKPLASKDIARQLNISSRMVRSSIAPVEQWLREKQIIVRKVPGEGFSLIGSNEAKRNLARMIREYDNPLLWLSSAERIQVLLLTLFFEDKPTQIKQLKEILNLSRTTTIRVMDSAENWLRDYRLELIRRPNYGCMISGEEHNWREAVIDLLYESAGEVRLLALFQRMKTVVDTSHRAKTGLEETLIKTWGRLDVAPIKKLTLPIEYVFKGRLSDQDHIDFCLYLAIAIYRNRIGKSISNFPELSKTPCDPQRLSEVRQISARVQELYGLHFPEAEIAWIALHLPETVPLLPPSSPSSKKGRLESSPPIRNIIEQFLAQASSSLHPSLSVDMDLIRNLSLHFERLLDLQQVGRTPKNPILVEVKSQYPRVYSVAHQSSRILTEPLGRELNEAEVGDIAICLIAGMERLRLSDRHTKRVLVVCSAGVVTAWLLVSRLRAEFPAVEVVEVISALELESRKDFEGIDFIVSTIPLKIKNLPSRQVNPLLGLEDCQELKEMFENKRTLTTENDLVHQSTIHLSDLVTSESIELGVVAENWQEVVDKAGSSLLATGAIEKYFIRAMKEIIFEYGPYMVIWPGAVLLHAPPDGVRRLCIGLMSLRKPVYFGHQKNDPVQVAVILGAMDNHSHITALQELNQMMQDEEARSAIQNTLHKSVVLHWVSRYSNSIKM